MYACMVPCSVTLNLFPSICMAFWALDTMAPRGIIIDTFTIYECERLYGRPVPYVKRHHPRLHFDLFVNYTALLQIFVCTGNVVGL